MKIFMTGATGYIGSVIVEKLVQAGHQVEGLARSAASAQALQDLGAEPRLGSLSDTQLLTDAAREADGVIQNAFDLRADFVSATTDEARAVDALIAGLHGSGKPLVYTSGTGGLGDTGTIVFDEETPIPAPQSPTVEALQRRFATEKAVTGAAGLRGVALRPPNVYGRGGGQSVLWLIGAAAQKLGAAPYPVGAGDNLWSLVHVDDLADLFVLAVEKAPAGELFHAATQNGLRTADIAAAIGHGVGLRGKTVALERADLADALGVPPLADYWSTNSQISGAKARRVLGWDPQRNDALGELARPSR
jgi:nucleoside-diphosphate-sugar epimerase